MWLGPTARELSEISGERNVKHLYVLVAVMALVAFMPAGRAAADNENSQLQAVPWTFVGTAAQCAPSPAGGRIVTSAWLGGMGLPDNGGDTALNSPSPATRSDPHSGLLLNKNGPTADCSSAGATITGVRGMDATAFVLGFDYRLGGHCGAGAPRFNFVTRKAGVDTFHFGGGCANAASTQAPQDPAQWSRIRFALTDAAAAFPPVEAGSTIQSMEIVYDEGTDNPVGTSDTAGVGLAVIDNIYINGQYIRSGPREGNGNNGKDKDKDKDKGDNEGDD